MLYKALLGLLERQQFFNGETCYSPQRKEQSSEKDAGLFERANCIMDMNADYTWSMNVMKQALGLLSNVGGLLTNLKLLMIVYRSK
ncbi:MAG: hypothetical protein M3Y53_01445 [Thermoproteota archaeon]|nr:hypothetical protein [Thermoproteota archaeon]